MDYQSEAELKVNIQNLYRLGGVPNVVSCMISICESQLVILRKLKELVEHTGD